MGERERFEELHFYQVAMTLLKAAYKLAGKLPDYEKYNLASQLRRAALSTTLNIAEGYGRYHFPDRLRFFYFARGSLFETLSGFVAAHALGFVDDEQLAWVRETAADTARSLNAYIGYIQKQRQGAVTYGDKYIHEPGVTYEIQDHSPIPDSLLPDCPLPDSLLPDSQIPDSLLPDSDIGENR